MQSNVSKQYLRIHQKTVIEHTLDCFLYHPSVVGVIVVLHSEDPYWKSVADNLPLNIPVYTVEGGNQRSDSVLQGLDYLSMVEKVEADHWVMVHDAARPCLTQVDLNALLELTTRTNVVGGILATPVKDTMKRAQKNSHTILKTENRDDLWHALTPQLFRLGELQQSLQQGLDSQANITDEASAMELTGQYPELVEGSSQNIKITRPDDIELATWLLSKKDDLN
jgi:2-C-methyl-D-erythritol 4-phosphate cytidylyltransferase